MADYCDFYYTALKDKSSIASKDFVCCECNKKIPKGLMYWLYQGKSSEDGSLSTFHQHMECVKACHIVARKDDCIPFGTLDEHLSDYDYGKETLEYIKEAKELFIAGKLASMITNDDKLHQKKYNKHWQDYKY